MNLKLWGPSRFKGLPMLRVLVFSTLILLMSTYAWVYFTGGYLFFSGAAVNATLNSNFQQIYGNNINPSGVFGGLGSLNRQLGAQGSNFSQPNSANPVGSGLSVGAAFFTTLPPMINTILIFAGTPFGYFGIPIAYFELVGSVMIVATIVLSIIAILSLVYS